MSKKKPKVNDLVKRESADNQIDRISELFKQAMQNAPELKTVTKFLWLPKTIEGETKWLVTASWQEEFTEEICHTEMYPPSKLEVTWIWKPIKWL